MLRKEYLFEDNHSSEFKIPVSGQPLVVNSGGSRIFGKLALPAVEHEGVRTPVLIMLHGHPGHDRNLDLMFSLKRTGMAVAFFSYRGIWGSHGDYCFTHLMEDTKAVFEHLREHAEEWRLDMDHCYLFGHSMGGFTALNSVANGLPVRGAIVMAPCDLSYVYETNKELFSMLTDNTITGHFHMPDDKFMERDAIQNHAKWRFPTLAEQMPDNVPIHFIGGSRDDLVPPKDHIFPIYEKLQERGIPTTYTEFDDGHSFYENRVGLIRLVFDKIAEMEK